MNEAYNQRTVKCVNPQCARFDEPRVVSFPLVGNGLYLTGGVMCECGFGGETVRVQE